jgi:hypothetical protein
MNNRKFGKFGKTLVTVNRALITYFHNIIDEFTDSDTTQQEKTELIASIGGGAYMVASGALSILTALITAISLILNPIQDLRRANERNAVQIQELRELKKELKKQCASSSTTSP